MKTPIHIAIICLCALGAQSEPLLSIGLLTNKTVSITFASELGKSYRILTNKSLPATNWSSVTTIAGTGTNVVASLSVKTSAMFYTVVTQTNPLFGYSFFVDTNSSAVAWMNTEIVSDPTNAALMARISTNATSVWLNGGPGQSDLVTLVSNRIVLASAVGQVPIFTLYNIPYRDCGSFSSGGATNAVEYTNWIQSVVTGMGATNPAVIILEPDALAHLDCSSLTSTQRTERITLIAEAIDMIKTQTVAQVYVDVGHSAWLSVDTAVSYMKQANVTHADGFSLNVANFQYDTNLITYGNAIGSKLGDMHYVIDSSRNGLGPDTSSSDATPWCNPPGRALGHIPTSATGLPLVDAFLWIKVPGESDGSCRSGEPPAGTFWPEYALGLATRASY